MTKAIPLLVPLMLAAAAAAREPVAPVRFDRFEYTGRDAVFTQPMAPGDYRNPILAGFYPDPDVCRVGGDYYLVNSTFAYFPGIPVFHSRDLVNWEQVGNVISRPTQLNYDGLGVSRGIFAPALSHHGDTFYLVCSFEDAGGNFLMTAKDAAGPWSDPVWLGFDGIDPSLFFDDDGRAWIVNNGVPPDNKPQYNGHRAIWMQEFDPAAGKMVGPRTIIVNGGTDLARHPVWIEGPHLFRKDGWYYLICAEGGTAEDHSEVVFRSRSVGGPYLPGPANPILTQRTLDPRRPAPVTCTGHAELVEAPGGGWWAVFLGCRPYEDGFFNTGRETFMLPVTWTGGWPVILPPGQPVPYVVPGPAGAGAPPAGAVPFTGNFTWLDDFEKPVLAPQWLMLRRPHESWWSLGNPFGYLSLTPGAETLSGAGNPTFLARRVQHARFDATTELIAPETPGVSAGIAIFQSEEHYYFFCVRRSRSALGDSLSLVIEKPGADRGSLMVHALPERTTRIELRVRADDKVLGFEYCVPPGEWRRLGWDFDATTLSTKAAGGFVGSVVGLHARIDPP